MKANKSTVATSTTTTTTTKAKAKAKGTINRLAIDWLNLNLDNGQPKMAQAIESARIISEVKCYLKSLDADLSPSAIKRAIGVTYFAGVNTSTKTEKGLDEDYLTLILYLSPASSSGINVCSAASEGCILACLNSSGRALMEIKANRNSIALSRLKKTWLAIFRRDLANKLIQAEIDSVKKVAEREGMKYAVRLNGTSDLDWREIMQANPSTQFYDYTKHLSSARKSASMANWHVTFSFSGRNLLDCLEAVKLGLNLAIPIAYSSARKGKISGLVAKLVDQGRGYTQDKTDLRFTDGQRNPLGLLAVKETPGTQKGIDEGFLVDLDGFEAIEAAVKEVKNF